MIGRSPRPRRTLPVVLAAGLVLAACGSGADADGADADGSPVAAASPGPATPVPVPQSPATPAPPPPPEPPPGYSPPDDWYERALASADAARRAVVAIGWDPPGDLRRRIEAGWLIAPDLVITSDAVACDVREGRDLRVRTFDGTIVGATVEDVVGACDGWEPGLARIRLSRTVDAPTLRLRTGGAPEVGAPLMVIGHANHAAAVGGWLVMVGPMVETQGDVLLADIGAPVVRWSFDEWFGGGSNGAPVVDLAGDVVAVLCCEREWGPQLRYGDAFAEPVLRRRLTIDGRYHVAGLWGEALRRTIGPAAG